MDKKIAVITGAASGIGLALTAQCLIKDFFVVMVDTQIQALEQHQKTWPSNVTIEQCDVRYEEQIQKLITNVFRTYKRIDLLINNAGITGHIAPLWELSSAEIHNVMDVNVYGMLYGIQACMPYWLEKKQSAHILNVASIFGLCSGSQLTAYTMSKHAVIGLSESLYFDLQRLNLPIRISVACPTLTNTNLIAHSLHADPSLFHMLLKRSLEDAQSPEEVASIIMQGLLENKFYIFPDAAVKSYCEHYTQALIAQTAPHEHALETLFQTLSRHAQKRAANKS